RRLARRLHPHLGRKQLRYLMDLLVGDHHACPATSTAFLPTTSAGIARVLRGNCTPSFSGRGANSSLAPGQPLITDSLSGLWWTSPPAGGPATRPRAPPRPNTGPGPALLPPATAPGPLRRRSRPR